MIHYELNYGNNTHKFTLQQEKKEATSKSREKLKIRCQNYNPQ